MRRHLPALLVLAACDREQAAGLGLDGTEQARLANNPTWSYTGTTGSHLGASVESGYLNTDSRPDVFAGAPFDYGGDGAIRGFFGTGASPWFPSTPSWNAVGDAGSRLGRCIAIGDFDGDGRQDLAAGSSSYTGGANRTGKISVWFGPLTGSNPPPQTVFIGTIANQYIGTSCDAIDTNGDGVDEILTSGYGNGGDGVAYLLVYNGKGLAIGWTYNAPQDSTAFAMPVANAGDVNGDGREDALIALPTTDNPDQNEGTVALFHGQLTKGYLPSTPDWQYEGAAYEANLGLPWSDEAKAKSLLGRGGIDGAGDVNDDGYDDIVVGRAFAGDDTSKSAEVLLFTGSAKGLSSTPTTTRSTGLAGGQFGATVRGIGDVNADGHDDVYVGEPGGLGDDGTDWAYFGVPDGLSTESWFNTNLGSGERRGAAATGVDDVDGDGRGEVVIVRDRTSTAGTLALHLGNKEPDSDKDGAVDILDCDDTDSTIFPGAKIIAGDGIDQDCDGDDECYEDRDQDRWGNTAVYGPPMRAGCVGDGESALPGDCDDQDAEISPDAFDRIGDGFDQDCDGGEDCYLDFDLDKWGTTTVITSKDLDCSDAGESVEYLDCDDTDPSRSPGLVEIYADGIDSDCDFVDLCRADADGDGHGNPLINEADEDLDKCKDAGESAVNDDCNDKSATVFTGAPEIMGNGIDEDCDGNDECWKDVDADTWGSTTSIVNADKDACADAGESKQAGDCKDDNKAINPGVVEVPGDGIDQNCDGADGCYQDVDLDGFGTKTAIGDADGDGCKDPGESLVSSDCKDDNKGINPSVTEIAGDGLDQDCDGVDECYLDSDKDSFGGKLFTPNTDNDACADVNESLVNTDCDDTKGTVKPGGAEVALDGIDQDCDGRDACYVDGDLDGVGGKAVVNDADGDGCKDPGESLLATDCNDADKTIGPTAKEVIGDGTDQDCDGVDVCWFDSDKDAFGAAGKTIVNLDKDCADANESLVATDCDDARADRYPGNKEVVGNGVDEDCNLQEVCYKDGDTDGSAGTGTLASADVDCTDPGEYAIADDCNDADKTVRPGATGIVGDGIDQDCDKLEECYKDGDLDSYGTSIRVDDDGDGICNDVGESKVATDCEDAQPMVHPGVVEIVGNLYDDDCNGTTSCYTDADDDTYGALPVIAGTDCTGSGEADDKSDCKDTDLDVNPGVPEIAGDGIDQNCDGSDGCFVDSDGDGHGSATVAGSCAGPNVASTKDDCADTDGTRFPGNVEVPADGRDQDCDLVDSCFHDGDADGFGGSLVVASKDLDCTDLTESKFGTDCDDGNATVNPGRLDVVGDDLDQDCDGKALCYADTDFDAWGAGVVAVADTDCKDVGEARVTGDCDDKQAGVNPSAPESTGNLIDEDCSGDSTCFVDVDSDGFGTDATTLCKASGTAVLAGDCDDGSAALHPGALDKIGDEIDSDCNREEVCFEDYDGDGVGSTSTHPGPRDVDCDDPGESTTSNDCDDTDVRAHPGAAEIVGNGVDDDCKGGDECYVDLDKDGVGTAVTQANEGSKGCTDAFEAAVSGDCDDTDPEVRPGAPDFAGDGEDTNCDGFETCWVDADQDGFGTGAPVQVPETSKNECAGAGYADNAEDCDDLHDTAFPFGTEMPGDGIDGDCNGRESCYLDSDGDGFGDDSVDSEDGLCADADEVAVDGDCDDSDADRYPGADDPTGDGIDQNCDGGDLCFRDVDGDGHGSSETFLSVTACEDGSLVDDDCDDETALSFPGNLEVCDSYDNDCDGTRDEDFPWADPDVAGSCAQEDVRLCGCQSSKSTGSSFALGALVLLFARRVRGLA